MMNEWPESPESSYKMHILKLQLGSVGFRQRPDQIQFLALLVGVNWRSLVVIDELIEIVELSLTDAVHSGFDVNAEVLVATGSFEGHGKVAGLEEKRVENSKN